jgi:hypothetical protein
MAPCVAKEVIKILKRRDLSWIIWIKSKYNHVCFHRKAEISLMTSTQRIDKGNKEEV